MRWTTSSNISRWVILFVGLLTLQLPAAPVNEPYRWQSVTIVAGGYVPGIIFSPVERDLIYCRTDIGGAYRWDAAEKRWTPLTDSFGQANYNFMGTESIALDPADPNKVYIAAGMYSRNRAAILRSSDRGKTFQIAEVPFSMGGNEDGRNLGERLAVDPHDPRVLYFGSRRDGLWKSDDGAVTWKKVDGFPFSSISFVIFDSNIGQSGSPSSNIYVGAASTTAPARLYHSADSGETWSGLADEPAGLIPQHAALNSQGQLYITYGNSLGPNGITEGAVWKYDTKLRQWANITPHLTGGGGGFCGLSLDQQHPGTLIVSTLDHWNPGDDLLRSTDGGQTWKGVNASTQLDPTLSPYLHWGRATVRFGWWISALAIDPFDSNHVLFGTGATIWGTQDFTQLDRDQPTHWTVAAKGMEETAVLDLASPPSGPHLISAVGDIGGFRHDDLSASPTSGMSKDPVFTNTYTLDFAELKPDIVVRSGTADNNPAFSYSQDSGATWKPLTMPNVVVTPGRRGGAGGGQTRDVVIVSANGGTLLSTRNPASISTDFGATWTPIQGLPANLRPVADRSNPKKFYAVDLANSLIYSCTDGGVTFTSQALTGLSATRGAPGRSVKLWATPGHEGDLWLLSAQHLAHSTDGGATFNPVSPTTTLGAFGFGMSPPGKNYPALFLAGTVEEIYGIFRSDDAGASWVRINDDDHQYGSVTVLTGDPRVFGRVYIGTNGRGILYGDRTATSQANPP